MSSDMSRMLREVQGRSTANMERERSLQQRRAALSELKNQVQSASDDLHKHRSSTQVAAQQFFETKRNVDEKVRMKEQHNAAQHERVAELERQEEQLKKSIESGFDAIEKTKSMIEQKQRESVALSQAEERLTALKRQVEDEDNTLMQLESKIGRLEAATVRRHHATMESLAAFPLPQVPSGSSTGGLESTATGSVILVDESK